jgi:HTH-type transcriptional regulator / antitoxin HigA
MQSTVRTNGKQIASRLNKSAYARLLTKILPTVITSDAQNRRVLAVIDELMDKPRRTREETELLKLLVQLSSDFDRQRYPYTVKPHEHLAELLKERKLRQADLLSIFGHRSAVSEVLAGKRGITKEQAKKLAGFFKLPVELFL